MSNWENVKQLNQRWNDLPRRACIVLVVLAALLAFAALFCFLYLVFNYESIARVPRLTQFQ